MRWKSKKPEFGEKSIENVFLLFPKLNEKTKTWHWLETVKLEYTWVGHRWSRFGEFIDG